MSHNTEGWVGVDLDGTLAVYTKGDYNSFTIGPPIPKMVSRVKTWLKEGKKVKIFTARANPETETAGRFEVCLRIIREWCLQHLGEELEITCSKDYHCYEIWDDRAIQVIPNTGITKDEIIEEKDNVINLLREALLSRWKIPDVIGL
jgi:hypothetical protein